MGGCERVEYGGLRSISSALVEDGSNRDQLVCKSHVNIASSPGISSGSVYSRPLSPPSISPFTSQREEIKAEDKENANEIATKSALFLSLSLLKHS